MTGIRHVLRAEGVNFAATMLDTQNISTIRGAGLALLRVPDAVDRCVGDMPGYIVLLAGASQCVCSFVATPTDARDARDRVAAALQTEPWNHLSFVVDVVAGDGKEANYLVEARNHARQLRQWTVPLPKFCNDSVGYDELDRMRPAVKGPQPPPGVERWSESTAARHEYGRTQRQAFYSDHKRVSEPADDLHFVDSFEELVGKPPTGLPLSLQNAMAVVYADGNGFRKIRDNATNPSEFSENLTKCQTALLTSILGWYRAGRDKKHPAFVFGDARRLRFETLMWGGDEVMFVLPAWLAFAFIEGFFAATRCWNVGSTPLTHAVGVTICHHKTPIRLARGLAHDLADGIKEAARAQKGVTLGNAVSIEILEGLMPPLDGLAAFRGQLYGTPADAKLTLALALPGERFTETRQTLRGATGDAGLPRSQLYRILYEFRSKLTGNDADIQDAYRKYAERVRTDRPEPPCLPTIDHTRPFGLDLALIARFWDYADPFVGDETFPAFPAEQPV